MILYSHPCTSVCSLACLSGVDPGRRSRPGTAGPAAQADVIISAWAATAAACWSDCGPRTIQVIGVGFDPEWSVR